MSRVMAEGFRGFRVGVRGIGLGGLGLGGLGSGFRACFCGSGPV